MLVKESRLRTGTIRRADMVDTRVQEPVLQGLASCFAERSVSTGQCPLQAIPISATRVADSLVMRKFVDEVLYPDAQLCEENGKKASKAVLEAMA